MDPRIRAWQPQWFLDPLTRLPNRTLFINRLDGALARVVPGARRVQRAVALFIVDLHELKYVNARYGHRQGDELLRIAAGRLVRCIGPGDTVSRFGGGEFVLLQEATSGSAAASVAAERLREALSEPFEWHTDSERIRIRLAPRLGIVVAPVGVGVDAKELLGLAQYALQIQTRSKRDTADDMHPEDAKTAFVCIDLLESTFTDCAKT